MTLPPGRARLGDEPARHRIGSKSEHNGEGPGRLLGGQGGGCVRSHDDINVERNQFGRKSGESLELILGRSVFDHEVAALDVTEGTQSLTEALGELWINGQVGRQVAVLATCWASTATGLKSPPRRRVILRTSLSPIISSPRRVRIGTHLAVVSFSKPNARYQARPPGGRRLDAGVRRRAARRRPGSFEGPR